MVVVVGREIVEDSNEDPHTIVRAVPLSVILHKCISPSLGVPVSVLIEVILIASAVIFVTSKVSVLLAGVADDDTVSILFVIRLFVRVAVALFLVASEVLSTFHSHTSHFTIPVGVFMTGDVRVLFVSVLILDTVGIVTPSTATTPADTREIVVSVACHTFTHAKCGLSLVQSPMSAGIAVTFSSSMSHVPAVLLPRIRFVFTFCILAKVTESSIISAVMLGVASS